MHAPLLPFYAGAEKGCGEPGAPDRNLPQARSCAGSRTGGGGPTPAPAVPAAPPGLRPECLPLAEASRRGACPIRKPAKKEEPFGSPVNVIRF